MSKVINLAKYKEIEVKIHKLTPVTEELIDAQINSMMQNQFEYVDKEGALEEGDHAIFDFCGKKDGVAFEGGTAKDYALDIGSHMFIPGFEEGMVGMTKGETRDLDLVFPEAYQEPTLAGQAVVFTVTLNQIQTKKAAVLDDAFVKNLGLPGVETVQAFRDYTASYLQNEALRQQNIEKENAVLDALVNASEVELDDEAIQEALDHHIQHIEADLARQGANLEMYLQFSGMTREQLENQLRDSAKQQAKFEAIIDAIVDSEKIETTDEEINEQATIIATQNQLKVEEVFEKIKPEDFKRDINRVKASQVVLTTAKYIEED